MQLPFETDDGIGTKARLGLVVLQTDETIEAEFARMMQLPGVALYHSRIPMVPEIKPETLAQMEADLPASAALFPEITLDVIGYGCTSASTVIGSDRVAAALKTVQPDAKVTDPMAALVAAAGALKAKRLGFLTPYVPDVSAAMRTRLEEAGFAIAAFGSFEEGDDRVVARICEASIAHAAQTVAAQSPCDAIIISCTNLRCLSVIAQIEQALGLPVISSNTALAWHMQRLAGLTTPQPEFGRLFTQNL